MPENPLVSIILPTYNRASIIAEAIDNILQQTYPNIELIVIDDGSTDNTLEILATYKDRIRVLTQANAGPAVARNRGIAAARGTIIAFQDSDDLWRSTKIERQVHLLMKYGESVPCCLCNAEMGIVDGKQLTSFDESLLNLSDTEGLWVNVLEVLATRFVLFNQTVAIRKSALERVGGFPEDLKYMEDYDLPLRLALDGPWAVIRDPLVIYRLGTSGSFSQRALKDPIVLRECAVTIFERILARIGRDPRHKSGRKLLERALTMRRMVLAGTRLTKRPSVLRRWMGHLLLELDHYAFAVFRRTPWFPQVVCVRSQQAPTAVS